MSDDFLEFSQSAGQSDIAPGVYLMTLVEISEPKTNTAQRGDNAGKEFTVRDWTFATDEDQVHIDSASVSRSSKSKQYTWVTALLGGTPPALDQPISFKQLIGRQAIVTIGLNENGWPKITAMSAQPQERAKPAGGAAAAARARAQQAPQPVAAGAASSNDDLPF